MNEAISSDLMLANRFTHVIEIAAARGSGQDRARVFETEDGLVVALADGAGGTGNGASAAQRICDAVGSASPTTDWHALLSALDENAEGQSTAVILSISRAGITGASVGDSGALLIDGDKVLELTEGQARKPLVGAGCIPHRITAPPLGAGTLLVASDGLFRYARHRDIARLASGPDISTAARALIDLVRLPTGTLQDDVSIVICRLRARESV